MAACSPGLHTLPSLALDLFQLVGVTRRYWALRGRVGVGHDVQDAPHLALETRGLSF